MPAVHPQSSASPLIGIVDYEMGNVRSVQKAFETVGYRAIVTRDPEALEQASHLVLPGVGAFPDCMANLARFGLLDPIRTHLDSGKPFLGICLGFQVLFTESEEFGTHRGMDVIPGIVRKFAFGAQPGPRLKVPHMGWNAIHVQRSTPLMEGIGTGAHMYFVHSYYVIPREQPAVCTTTEYGIPFVSSVQQDNIFACQFHPEKSQAVGLRLLRHFGEWRA